VFSESRTTSALFFPVQREKGCRIGTRDPRAEESLSRGEYGLSTGGRDGSLPGGKRVNQQGSEATNGRKQYVRTGGLAADETTVRWLVLLLFSYKLLQKKKSTI